MPGGTICPCAGGNFIHSRRIAFLPRRAAAIMAGKQSMKHILRYIALALFVLGSAAFAAAPQAHAFKIGSLIKKNDFQLAPHKALYDIKMVSKKSGSQVLNISGQMYFEGKETCDAWLTDHRFKLLYEYADSPPMTITSNFSTYETLDGLEFSYTSRRERNGELYEELRGHAERNKDGAGKAVYSMPEGLEFPISEQTLFPIAHTNEIVRKIRDEKKFFAATVFDGSDKDGPVEINTFISAAILQPPTENGNDAIDASLLASPARNVRMAFFPLANSEAGSDYEMSIVFHDNGIISDMLVEYDEFSIKQTLAALDRLETPVNCNKNPAPEK